MHLRLSLSLLLIAATALLTSSTSRPQPQPAEPSECALSLVALSPCLSYITGPPNIPTPAPSVVCCGAFHQTFVTTGPSCICYLVRDPLILGFPVDTGRLVSLFPSCRANESAPASFWLHDACRGVYLLCTVASFLDNLSWNYIHLENWMFHV